MVGAADGSGIVPFVEGKIGALSAPEWLPGAAQFLYMHGQPGTWWLGGPGGSAQRFPSETIRMTALVWADPQTFVYSTAEGDGFALFLGLLDIPAEPQRLVAVSTYPLFDAVLP